MKQRIIPLREVPKHVPIALLAGRGSLPEILIHVFQRQKRPFVILAFKEQTEEKLVQNLPHSWIHFGEIGKALNYLKKNHIQEIVMAGTLARPTLRELSPDWKGVKWLARIGSKALGDDSLLKSIIGMLEEEGLQVVGPDDVLSDLLAPEGLLIGSEPDEQAWRDIGRGIEVLSALGTVDVGQAIIVQEGLILGIEAIEGTDALIERAYSLKRPGSGGILIKISKHHQEKRVDLPAIGPHTVLNASQVGLRGIAIEAGRTLLINKEETLKLAHERGIFIISLASAQCRTFL